MTIKIPSFLLYRWFQVAVIIVLVGGGFAYTRLSNAAKPTLNTYTVQRQDIEQTVTASGSLTASKMVSLKFPMGGYLNWVGVKKGRHRKAMASYCEC